MTVITLTRAVTAIDRELTEITLREPTGADLVKAGYPMRFTGSGASEIDANAMTALMARLGNVPRGTMEAMAFGDWNRCMLAVLAFLGVPTSPTSSTAISSAPGSGATN